jgi:hypothetical protein
MRFGAIEFDGGPRGGVEHVKSICNAIDSKPVLPDEPRELSWGKHGSQSQGFKVAFGALGSSGDDTQERSPGGKPAQRIDHGGQLAWRR